METAVSNARLTSTVRDLVSLTKPRITLMVLITTAGGMWLAPPGGLSWSLVAVMLLATGAVVGSANALNCWLERDVDRHMTRTARRPLPAGRLDPRLALGFGLALGVVSVPVLAFAVNPLTGLLGAAALVSYVAVYTPLKQRSPAALLVGAVPGALPPLMGWTAATGNIEAPAVVLFGILFLWQLPHFLAIALFRKDEYANAGLRVLPAVRGDRVAKWHLVLYAGALVPVSLMLVPMGVAGSVYLTVAAVAGAAFLGASVVGLRRAAGLRWARGVFVVSLVYLTALFAALLVDAG
ncbi:MAG: heme o synthase [Myxococcota bacterium]